MPLTANREVNRFVDQELRVFLVAAGQHVFKGALIGINRAGGFARHLAEGDLFVGIAYEEIDNSAGQDGDKSVRVYTEGDFILPTSGATQALIGSALYATGDEGVALTTIPGGSYVGKLVGLDSVGQSIVRLQPMATPQVEHAVNVALASSTSEATTNPVLIAQRPIRVLNAQVSFNTVPDAGQLDVGTDNSDPDEIVNAFDLSGLAANTPATLTLIGSNVAAGQRIWARVGQATGTAGVGGVLTVRYIELP